MKSNKEEKTIPSKNYVIFIIMVIFTIALTFLLSNWYTENKKLSKGNTIMSEFLVKMNEQEFKNYTLENPNAIIYLANSKDESLNEFEEEFKKLIVESGIESQIIFLDLQTIDDNFFNELKDTYFSNNIKNIEIENYTNILIMEDRKITAVLYNKSTPININDVKNMFYDRGVLGQA